MIENGKKKGGFTRGMCNMKKIRKPAKILYNKNQPKILNYNYRCILTGEG